MTLQTRNDLMMQRWGPEIQCQDQVEDGIQDLVWNATMDNDSLGRTWGPAARRRSSRLSSEGIMRVRAPFCGGGMPARYLEYLGPFSRTHHCRNTGQTSGSVSEVSQLGSLISTRQSRTTISCYSGSIARTHDGCAGLSRRD